MSSRSTSTSDRTSLYSTTANHHSNDSSATNSQFLTSKSYHPHVSQRPPHEEHQNGTALTESDIYTTDSYTFDFRQLLEWEYDPTEFDPYEFISSLPDKDKLPPESLVKRICIPRKQLSAPRITLVLDLDETLVHCSTVPIKKADFTFPVTFNGVEYQVYVRKRPYFELFLNETSKMFEVVVFTASHKVYANKLLDLLDRNGRRVHHRVFRDSCLQVDGNYLKDLCVLGRNLSHMCIIDNSPQAYAYQIHNGIPISSWYDDEQDTALLKILPFLKQLSQTEDVRPIIRQKFKFHKVIDEYRNRRRTNPQIDFRR